jgi:rod shape-determining protein MreD
VRAARIAAAVAVALALQTTLSRFIVDGTAAVDLGLVVVVYVALTGGPVTGMLTGSAAGLLQDALSSGVVGIGGFARALVGFVAGVIGQQFIVTAALPRFVMFLAASVLHAVVFMGLYMLLGLRTFQSPVASTLSQALGNAVVGMIAFTLIEAFPRVLERRKLSRSRK